MSNWSFCCGIVELEVFVVVLSDWEFMFWYFRTASFCFGTVKLGVFVVEYFQIKRLSCVIVKLRVLVVVLLD